MRAGLVLGSQSLIRPGSASRALAPATCKALSLRLLIGSAGLRSSPALAGGGGTDLRAGTPRASVSGFSQAQPPGAGVAPRCWCGPRAPMWASGCRCQPWAPVWAPGVGVAPGRRCGPWVPVWAPGTSVGLWVPVWAPGAGVAPRCWCGPWAPMWASGCWCGPWAPARALRHAPGLGREADSADLLESKAGACGNSPGAQ